MKYKQWVTCVSFRMHQASLEAARQRLEEYQRALQTCYSIDAKEPPPHQPPLLSTWSSQLAAALSHLPNSAMQTSLQDTQTHTREGLPVSAPCSPDFRAHVESILSNARPRAADVSPRLAEVLLERIKGRLQDTARPGQMGALPQDPVHPLSLGPTKDRIGGRREEQQVVVLQRRQQSQTGAWEVEHRRQHLPSDAQVGDGPPSLNPHKGSLDAFIVFLSQSRFQRPHLRSRCLGTSVRSVAVCFSLY